MSHVVSITGRKPAGDDGYVALLRSVSGVCAVANEAIIICEAAPAVAELRIASVNAAFLRLVGSNESEYLGRRAEFDDLTRKGHLEITRGDGSALTLEVTCVPIEDEQGRLRHLVVFCSDVTLQRTVDSKRVNVLEQTVKEIRRELRDREHVERLLLEAACRDSLTGLPNRLLFLEHAKEALIRRRRVSGSVSILFIDCDRFKLVNDTFGHLVGDMLLVEVSRRLRDCLRPADVLARVGGDEFVVLFEGTNDRLTAMALAQRLAKSLSSPFQCAGEEFYLSASVGVAESMAGDESADVLMRNADIAMYQAKSRGGGQCERFSSELYDRLLRRRMLESDLHRALDLSEVTVAYQPIVRLADRTPVGFEALARWNHPQLGAISPTEFIPIAEESNFIIELGSFLLFNACASANKWQTKNAAAKCMPVSVNVTFKQLFEDRFSRRIAAALMASGLRAENLNIEITETTLMKDPSVAASLLQRLRGIGVASYIDDFGTGLTSLTHLQRFPVSRIKIDSSFISGKGDGLVNPVIVEMIIALGKHLGIPIVAEGIESAEQAAALTSLGCDFGQGHVFSKELSSDAVLHYLTEQVQGV